MDIVKYCSYFHDGSLINIRDNETDVQLFLESAEVDPSSFSQKFQLTNENTIQGILHLQNIRKVLVDDQIIDHPLTMKYSDGEILKLNIQKTVVFLLIEWKNYPPIGHANDVSKIEIESEKIYWEDKLFKGSETGKNDKYLDAKGRAIL